MANDFITCTAVATKICGKWENCFKTSGEFKVSLCLPPGQKIDCCLSRNASAKVKFEKCVT